MPAYAFDFEHNGTTRCLTVQADDELEARSIVEAMSDATFEGEVVFAGEAELLSLMVPSATVQ